MPSVSPPACLPSSPAAEIIETLAPLLAQHRRRWAARCHARGISFLGFHALAVLEMDGAIPMTRLADELGVALPNATGLVGRLDERGLVTRRTEPSDRRVVLVELTPEGRRAIDEMEAERTQRMTRLIGQLDATQQRRLLESVKDLGAAARRLGDQE